MVTLMLNLKEFQCSDTLQTKKLCAKNLLNPSATKKLVFVELAHWPLKIIDLLLRKGRKKEAVEEKMRTGFNFVIWVTGARHLSHRCVWLVKVHLSGRLVSSEWNLYPPQSNSRWAPSRDGLRLSATVVISYFKTLPPALCRQHAPGVPVKFTSGEQVQINKSLTDQERK